eukprot:243206_1
MMMANPHPHKHSLVPSPVSTATGRPNVRKPTPTPHKRSSARYPGQRRGPPSKTLPSIESNRQSNSNPVTPIAPLNRETHGKSISHANLKLNYPRHEDSSPMTLQMSQTSPVDNHTKYKLKPMKNMKNAGSADRLDKHHHQHFSAVSADNLPYYTAADLHNNHHDPYGHTYSQSSQYDYAQPPNVLHHTMGRTTHMQRTQSSRLDKEHRKKRKHRHKHKRKHKKKYKGQSQLTQPKMRLERSNSDRVAVSPVPSIGSMQTLIHRAETYGDREASHTSKTSHQAPQVPMDNSIFDNSNQEHSGDHSFFGDDMDSKADPDGYRDRYEEKEHVNRNGNALEPRAHLPLKNYGSSPVDMHPKQSNRKKHRGVSQMRNRDIQIKKLRKEIRELEERVTARKMTLCALEKDNLHESIERLRPITLLKRLIAFCEDANEKELELIEGILAHDMQFDIQ